MDQPNWKVRYVYLTQQFANPKRFLEKIRAVAMRGDFTLGREEWEFEETYAKKFGIKHAIGVGNGTDALFLSLRALGIGEGDEVITAPNSFIATAGAIAIAGARPVFVDVRDDYTIDPKAIERAITPKTKAIIPVHLFGNPADMYPILDIAKRHNLFVIEDAAQSSSAMYDNKYVGSFGNAAGFSFHPQKIVNIWGDGGMITTNNDSLAEKLRLWRNHGLKNRDETVFFAHNSRLDTIQAVVADIVLSEVDENTRKRAANAALYDELLSQLEPNVHIPNRKLSAVPIKPIYTLYVIQARRQKELISFLREQGIEALVHYPIPIHFQEAARYLGYKKGDFPVCEKQAETMVTLPIHQYLESADIRYVSEAIRRFYES